MASWPCCDEDGRYYWWPRPDCPSADDAIAETLDLNLYVDGYEGHESFTVRLDTMRWAEEGCESEYHGEWGWDHILPCPPDDTRAQEWWRVAV